MAKVKPLYNTINPRAGHSSHFIIEIPQDFILIIDTEEQRPLFIEHGSISKKDYSGELLVTRQHLEVADYSLKGFTDKEGIIIERKSVDDLYSSLFGDWERERRKLERMANWFRKWLLIEDTEANVLRYREYSKVSPNSMRGRLCEIELRLGIPIYFANGRLEAERFILYRLTKFMRLKREGKI